MTKARDALRTAWLAVGRDPSSAVSSHSLKQKQTEFSDRVTEINLKVDRLNMIVPTLYQQIARFDVVKEEEMIAAQCREHTELQPASAYNHQQPQQSDADSSTVTLTDVLRELKALFTA